MRLNYSKFHVNEVQAETENSDWRRLFLLPPALCLLPSAVTFKRKLRNLAKKYRSIRDDIEPVIVQLQMGELPGDKISGIGYEVFKTRVRNSDIQKGKSGGYRLIYSDIQKGKSGGYRLIYYVKSAKGIILLTIYAKSEQADILADEIRSIISEYEQLALENTEDC